jgi:hypothetical protein
MWRVLNRKLLKNIGKRISTLTQNLLFVFWPWKARKLSIFTDRNLAPQQLSKLFKFVVFTHSDLCAENERHKLNFGPIRKKFRNRLPRSAFFGPLPRLLMVTDGTNCDCSKGLKEILIQNNVYREAMHASLTHETDLRIYKRLEKASGLKRGSYTSHVELVVQGNAHHDTGLIPEEIAFLNQDIETDKILQDRVYRLILNQDREGTRRLSQKYRALNQKQGIHGFGDFIYGCFKIHEIAAQFQFLPEIDISGHPISQVLVSRITSSNLPKNIFHDDSDFQFLRHRTVFTNKRPKLPPNFSSRDFVLSEALCFKERYEKEFQELIESEKLSHRNYAITHLRLGDHQLFKMPDSFEELDILVSQIQKQSKGNPKLRDSLFMSDSEMLREILNKNGFRTLNLPVVHLGNSEVSIDSIKAALFEYRIMIRAREILQVSSYSWGSAFSETASILGAVPLNRVNLQDFMLNT